MKTTKNLIFLAIILFSMAAVTHETKSQSYISGSAGMDFSTLQVYFGGKIAPIYSDEDKLSIGFSTPITLTGHYTYQPLYSTAINSQDRSYNMNIIANVAAAINLSYQIDDDLSFKIRAGYGTLGNSEPMSFSLDENNMPTNSAMDYLAFGTHLDLGVQYQKLELRFINLINYHQLFAHYHVTDSFFVGLGYRQLNQLIEQPGNSFPKSPSTLQATAGIRWGKR